MFLTPSAATRRSDSRATASGLGATRALAQLVKRRLEEQFGRLDPVRLLRDIRSSQDVLRDLAGRRPAELPAAAAPGDVTTFLDSLTTAWKTGEVRATHRKQESTVRWWRTREDPFAQAWPVVEGWLISSPTATAKELMQRLAEIVPDSYAGNAQLRTLQRRIKAWRAERAKDMILGQLRKASVVAVETQTGD